MLRLRHTFIFQSQVACRYSFSVVSSAALPSTSTFLSDSSPSQHRTNTTQQATTTQHRHQRRNKYRNLNMPPKKNWTKRHNNSKESQNDLGAPIVLFKKPAGGKTYFVSGHIDIEEPEFLAHYSAALDAAIAEGGLFVIGDAPGVDVLAQNYIIERAGEQRLAVFCRGDTPRCLASKKVKLFSGFEGHTQKDAAMTRASDVDIAWVRSAEEQMAIYGDKYRPRVSGTEKNLKRRAAMVPVDGVQSSRVSDDEPVTTEAKKKEGESSVSTKAPLPPTIPPPPPAAAQAQPSANAKKKKKTRVMF